MEHPVRFELTSSGFAGLHIATLPRMHLKMADPLGIEPKSLVLQTSALTNSAKDPKIIVKKNPKYVDTY